VTLTLSDQQAWADPAHLAAANALLIAVVVIAAISVWGAVRHGLCCKPSRCECPFPLRWVAGRSLNGHTYTDATFLRGHTRVLTPTGHCSPFAKLPGWKRRVIRNAPLLLAAALLASWVLTVTALAAAGVAWGILRHTGAGRKAAGRLRHPMAWFSRVQGMSMAISGVTGTSAAVVQRGLTWNRDYANAAPGGHVLSWVPPRGFKATQGERSTVENLLASRVGFDLVPEWRMADERPVLNMTRARELPGIVYLRDVLAMLEALPEHKTGIGLDDQGRLECWDWATENPHGLLNAGSRHGKTETMEGMVAQVLRKGGRVTYVDVKRVSIQGMKGLPGLTLLDNPRDMAAMWLAIAEFGKELDKRIDDRTKDPTLQFDRHLLVIEEVNQFKEMCDEFWENWPEEDEDWRRTILWKPKRAKRTPPIWRVVKHGVWEGAFAKMNVLIAGQNIEAQTVAGIRNSIGMRLLGGYQPQNWKALVGTTPAPAAPPVKGRWCLVNGSSQTWLQAILADLDANASAAIWRDYARAGRRLDGSLPPVTDAPVTYHVDMKGQVSAVNGATPGHVTEMGLSDIAAAGLVRASVKALRMDRHRSDLGELPDGLKFPEPVRTEGQKELFSVAEVQEFDAQRRGPRGVAR
jgi:hypothetical protein